MIKMFNQKISLKIVIILILTSILIASATTYIFAQTPTPSTFTISPGIYLGASYTIWREGNYYYAKNAYGAIDYFGTDATQVVQNAIDALDNGGKIVFWDGVYFLGQINLVSNLIVEAISPNVKIVKNTGSHLFTGSNLQNVTIRGFTVDCNGVNFPSGCTIAPTNTVDLKIEDNDFFNWKYHVIHPYKQNKRLVIRNNRFHHGVTDHYDPIAVGGTDGFYGSEFIICNNIFYEISFAYSMGAGFLIDSLITDNVFKNVRTAIGLEFDIYRVSILNNVIINATMFGVFLNFREDYEVKDVIVLGNKIEGSFARAINLYGTIDTDVKFNYIRRYPSELGPTGIYLYDNVNGTEVIGNTIIDCGVAVRPGTGINNVFRFNKGYVTENWGTETISASTSVTFNHGLAGVPTHVEIGWKDRGYGDWSWSATSTQITITVTNSGTYDFSWYAEYRP